MFALFVLLHSTTVTLTILCLMVQCIQLDANVLIHMLYSVH